MSKSSTLLVGHVCIDHNTSERASYTGWGSSVLYIASYLHKYAGASPAILTSYGSDILPYLPEGIALLPVQPNQAETLVYENDTTGPKRIWRCRNPETSPPPALTPETLGSIAGADILIVATLLPNYSPDYIKELMSHAKPGALKVLCPQGYFRTVTDDKLVVPRDFPEAPAVLPYFDLVIYSEEDHPKAMEMAKIWKQDVDTEIIVTQNEKGATIVEKDEAVHIPTTPIAPENIVDSVGCGDIFAASVAAGYYESKDLQTAIQAAHKIAAQKLLSVITVK
jgi:sugar/nucleoside kinase (ribokinase family)